MLLLAMRCLVLLLLGLALAGPIWSALGAMGSLSRSGRIVVMIVDNSITSGATGADGTCHEPSEVYGPDGLQQACEKKDACVWSTNLHRCMGKACADRTNSKMCNGGMHGQRTGSTIKDNLYACAWVGGQRDKGTGGWKERGVRRRRPQVGRGARS